MNEQNNYDRLLRRWGSLKQERSSYMDHWREISEYVLPRSGRFMQSEANRGGKKHNAIHDSTGTKSLRILEAGLMAGMTSPARPWFRLTTSDPNLDDAPAVKKWLAEVTRQMQMVFSRSNTYRALHACYEELGAFGTASSIILSDYDTVIHHYPLTIGEYAAATDHRGMVDTLYREFEMTVGQMVPRFGKKNCSNAVIGLWDRFELDKRIRVLHAIQPNPDRDLNKRDNRNMAFESVYCELGAEQGKRLSQSGFKDFPAICPRWMTSGGDVYGLSPAMESLGDIKQLQHEQLRKAQGIDYKTKPPLQMPTSLKNVGANTLPGGATYVDVPGQTAGIRPLFESQLDLSHLLEDIRDVRERIKGNFYADLFLMLSNGNNPSMTATEVAERHEEKLLMIGPVLENLHNEILYPKIDITFNHMLNAGILPPAPEELQGMDLNVEFVSILAQAQRAVATNAIDKYVANLGQVASLRPEVLDKFDADHWADVYADALGVDPEMVVPSDKVALIRRQRAQAAQQQQQVEQAAQQADAMQKLGNVDTGGKNAATDLMGMFSGYNSPGPAGL